MSELIERLRKPVDPDDPNLWVVDKDRLDAVAEIERLRAENVDLRRWKALDKPLTAAMAIVNTDIERLRAALTTIRDTFAKDIAQGYRTNDKQFAIDIANGVLLQDQQSTPGVHTGYNGDEHTGNRDVCTICLMWDQVRETRNKAKKLKRQR
jgi:hypothetical protein